MKNDKGCFYETNLIDIVREIYSNRLVMMYMFSYGSLMYPEGINGRGMMYNYTIKDLIPTVLRGYKRGPYGLNANMAKESYYGIIRSDESEVVGTLVPVYSQYDLKMLMGSELTFQFYDPEKSMYILEEVDVSSDSIDVPVKTLVCNHDQVIQSRHMPMDKSYVERVYKTIVSYWGEDFAERCVETGIQVPS